ncbi:hypothetical protein GCM10010123_42750 [Pilimelia anulata]|uniref:Prepilin-type N-terminal cleavage/methylation domain-containing protein n=1 Tax=Pilimelia anulata TaxID=53371 RepID=A0A8J3BBG0_9ACTN|nr:Ig domain-containing protein [Pilimelia anulata]GGK08258.1 hypothetical protein GCM10010123_42750 [Pilimelia anulata]
MHPVVRRRLARPVGGADPAGGFTLVEVMVAAALVAVVMLPVTMFMVRAMRTTDAQGGVQEATRIAADSLDTARGLPVADLVRGRDIASVTAQWAAAPTALRDLLSSMSAASDPAAAAGSGASAALSTAPSRVAKVDGVPYDRQYYVGRCWQVEGTAACVGGGTGVAFYRVVVAVVWRGGDCAADGCVYRSTTTRMAATTDPVFNPSALSIAEPGAQTGTVGAAVSVQLAAVNASGDVAWTAEGLPAGVTLNPRTGAFAGRPTAAGAYTVRVTATDSGQQAATRLIPWVIR